MPPSRSLRPSRPAPATNASPGRSRRGAEAFTRLVLAVFRVHGTLLRAGDALVADLGVTSARWQVLGAVALADQPPTAPQIGARMGLSRQGAQKQIDLLVTDGLLESRQNPAHRRSPTYALTASGRSLYARLSSRQRRWAEALASAATAEQWTSSAARLEDLAARLHSPARPPSA